MDDDTTEQIVRILKTGGRLIASPDLAPALNAAFEARGFRRGVVEVGKNLPPCTVMVVPATTSAPYVKIVTDA